MGSEGGITRGWGGYCTPGWGLLHNDRARANRIIEEAVKRRNGVLPYENWVLYGMSIQPATAGS